jgi:hypothetical protein
VTGPAIAPMDRAPASADAPSARTLGLIEGCPGAEACRPPLHEAPPYGPAV